MGKLCFLFQAEDGIRDIGVTGVQTCALPISLQLLTYTLMQVPAGALADSFGPRRVFGAGGLLTGVGVLLFSLAPSFPGAVARSEERRVGAECGSRWSPDHYKKTETLAYFSIS